MIGILIVAHGSLGESLIDCATYMMGARPERLLPLDITHHPDTGELASSGRQAIERLDDGSGVLVLSDMYGGTPCNTACRMLEPGRVAGVAGVSLPMLMRALTYRHLPLDELVDKALSGGREGVTRIALATEAATHE
jgi:PTS system ascorbate-specific IIA component